MTHPRVVRRCGSEVVGGDVSSVCRRQPKLYKLDAQLILERVGENAVQKQRIGQRAHRHQNCRRCHGEAFYQICRRRREGKHLASPTRRQTGWTMRFGGIVMPFLQGCDIISWMKCTKELEDDNDGSGGMLQIHSQGQIDGLEPVMCRGRLRCVKYVLPTPHGTSDVVRLEEEEIGKGSELVARRLSSLAEPRGLQSGIGGRASRCASRAAMAWQKRMMTQCYHEGGKHWHVLLSCIKTLVSKLSLSLRLICHLALG